MAFETTTGKQQILIMSMTGFFILYFIVISSGNINLIPATIMKQYKFGNFSFEKLVLNKTGCQIIKSYNIEFNESNNEVCAIKNGKIISRLGNEMLIEYENKNINDKLRFTLPASAVLSFHLKEAKHKSQ